MTTTDQKEAQKVVGEVLAVARLATKYGPNKQTAGKPAFAKPAETAKQPTNKTTEKPRKLNSLDQKVQKKSLDKVVVGLKAKAEVVRKPAIATKVLVKPTDTSDQDDSIEEVVEEKKNKFNGDESTEAQEIIRDLTKQLSDLEDKFVEGKAENFSKDEKIRKLSENISTITSKFEELKNDRSELVKSMKTNVELIEKLKVVTSALGERDEKIEELKAASQAADASSSFIGDLKRMRLQMMNQNKKVVDLEIKLKEYVAKESKIENEMAEKDAKIKQLLTTQKNAKPKADDLNSVLKLKKENEALRSTIDEKGSEIEQLEAEKANIEEVVTSLKTQVTTFQDFSFQMNSKIEIIENEKETKISAQENRIKEVEKQNVDLKDKASKYKTEVEKTKEKLMKKESKIYDLKKELKTEKTKENKKSPENETLKHKDTLIDQLEIENNKLLRQNLDNLPLVAEKAKSRNLEEQIRNLERERRKTADVVRESKEKIEKVQNLEEKLKELEKETENYSEKVLNLEIEKKSLEEKVMRDEDRNLLEFLKVEMKSLTAANEANVAKIAVLEKDNGNLQTIREIEMEMDKEMDGNTVTIDDRIKAIQEQIEDTDKANSKTNKEEVSGEHIGDGDMMKDREARHLKGEEEREDDRRARLGEERRRLEDQRRSGKDVRGCGARTEEDWRWSEGETRRRNEEMRTQDEMRRHDEEIRRQNEEKDLHEEEMRRERASHFALSHRTIPCKNGDRCTYGSRCKFYHEMGVFKRRGGYRERSGERGGEEEMRRKRRREGDDEGWRTKTKRHSSEPLDDGKRSWRNERESGSHERDQRDLGWSEVRQDREDGDLSDAEPLKCEDEASTSKSHETSAQDEALEDKTEPKAVKDDDSDDDFQPRKPVKKPSPMRIGDLSKFSKLISENVRSFGRAA